MKTSKDAYGKQLLTEYLEQRPTVEIIERDDNLILTASHEGMYFTGFEDWSELEKQAITKARGRVLDVGCGAGRHSLYLQEKGFDVTGIDNSPGAIRVCKLRGLKKALVRPVDEIDKFRAGSFDTIIMLGNNFGLFGSRRGARSILKKMARITTPDARIIAATLDPYKTDSSDHLDYHRRNRRRGRMGGQIRFRVRFGRIVGDWFDYLFVSQAEMTEILEDTDWRIKELLDSEKANYAAVIEKR